MATISKPNTFSAGAVVIAAEHNENFDTIYNEFNGSISNANIASNANITDTKLAQITTANKVAVSAIQVGALSMTSLTATATLVIPGLTADPGSPVTGQMWLRTDI